LIAALANPLGGRGETSSSPGESIAVLVSILPQRYFVERIGGDAVRVSVVVRPGESPATYGPKPSQLREAAKADVYLAIGVPFERGWGPRVRAMFPRLRWVDSTEGIERLALEHRHGDGHGSDGREETLDPHLWLSPRRAAVMAAAIAQTLTEIQPDRRARFERRLERLDRDIRTLDADLQARFASAPNRTFLVFHPSWGYFARDYGLEMLAIEAGGQEPSAFELAAVIRKAKERGVRDIFVQPEFSAQSARAVAEELGGNVVVLSPLAEDWLNHLRQAGAAIARSLSPEPAGHPADQSEAASR
jgi:zinc transport system substrate-binding protein